LTTLLEAVNQSEALLNLHQYRWELRHFSTDELATKANEKMEYLKALAKSSDSKMGRSTDDWEVRELLAEIGRRQMRFDV
jgi:hypothetical protein